MSHCFVFYFPKVFEIKAATVFLDTYILVAITETSNVWNKKKISILSSGRIGKGTLFPRKRRKKKELKKKKCKCRLFEISDKYPKEREYGTRQIYTYGKTTEIKCISNIASEHTDDTFVLFALKGTQEETNTISPFKAPRLYMSMYVLRRVRCRVFFHHKMYVYIYTYIWSWLQRNRREKYEGCAIFFFFFSLKKQEDRMCPSIHVFF